MSLDESASDALQLLHTLVLLEQARGAVLAEIDLRLQRRLHVLHVVVQRRNGNDSGQGGDRTAI